MKAKILVCFLMLLMLSSCGGGGGGGGGSTVDAQKVIAEKQWRTTSMTISPAYPVSGSTTASDLYPYLDACDKDDLLYFSASGAVAASEGATKCNAGDPDVYLTSNWALLQDQLTYDSSIYKVLELTNGSLKLQYSFTDGGVDYTVVEGFVPNS